MQLADQNPKMGKYMKKSKISAKMSLSEISTRSSLPLGGGGVRTRARTVALRRLHMNRTVNPNSSSSSSSCSSNSSSCYLELRSRRLRKPPQAPIKLRNQLRSPKLGPRESPNFCSSPEDERARSVPASYRSAVHSASAAAESASASLSLEEMQGSCGGHSVKTNGASESGPGCGASEESYGGDHSLEPDDQTDRRSSVFMTRRTARDNDIVPDIPSAHEMEEFFANAEREQQMLFIEKYNFDVSTDTPLPGRFEWVRVRP